MGTPLSKKIAWELANSLWAATLNPLIANPVNEVVLLNTIALTEGNNVINHMLGKTQQGWFLTDIQSGATIYRSAPFNDLTLTLAASAPVTVSIGVF